MKEKQPVPELINKWDQVLADNDRVMEPIYRQSGIERTVYQPKPKEDKR